MPLPTVLCSYYGIINVQHLGAWAWATYTAVLACIVATGLANEAYAFAAQCRRRGAPGQSPPRVADSTNSTAASDEDAQFLSSSAAGGGGGKGGATQPPLFVAHDGHGAHGLTQ